MTVQLSDYFSFEKGGTESLPNVFVHDNCEQIYFYFYFLPSNKKRDEKRDSFYTAKRVYSCRRPLAQPRGSMTWKEHAVFR